MINLHLTGFGKFADVEKNPTTELIENLPLYLKEHPLTNVKKVNFVSSGVVTVSAIDSLDYLKDLVIKHKIFGVEESITNENITLFLHFGVGNSQQCAFHLESVAWNEANFRVAGKNFVSQNLKLSTPLLTNNR